MAFKLRSQGAMKKHGSGGSCFKMMGSSPLKNDGHGAPAEHKHPDPKTKDNPKSWYSQTETVNDDGSRKLTTERGVEGDKGSTTKPTDTVTPAVEEVVEPTESTTPPKKYPDDDKVHGQACSDAYIAKHGTSACEAWKKQDKEKKGTSEETAGEVDETPKVTTETPNTDTPKKEDTAEKKEVVAKGQEHGKHGYVSTNVKPGLGKRIETFVDKLKKKKKKGETTKQDCGDEGCPAQDN